METTKAYTGFKDKNGERIKHLIVLAHPDPKSLSVAYKDEIVQLTEDTNNEVVVRDLYNLGFHPVLSMQDFGALRKGEIPDDIKLEQDYITRNLLNTKERLPEGADGMTYRQLSLFDDAGGIPAGGDVK